MNSISQKTRLISNFLAMNTNIKASFLEQLPLLIIDFALRWICGVVVGGVIYLNSHDQGDILKVAALGVVFSYVVVFLRWALKKAYARLEAKLTPDSFIFRQSKLIIWVMTFLVLVMIGIIWLFVLNGR